MAIRLNPIFLIDGPLGKDRNADVHGYTPTPLRIPSASQQQLLERKPLIVARPRISKTSIAQLASPLPRRVPLRPLREAPPQRPLRELSARAWSLDIKPRDAFGDTCKNFPRDRAGL